MLSLFVLAARLLRQRGARVKRACFLCLCRGMMLLVDVKRLVKPSDSRSFPPSYFLEF